MVTKKIKPLKDTPLNRSKIVIKKIKHQVASDPESQLIFAVFATAINDCFVGPSARRRSSALRRYLRQRKIYHLEILGLDTNWARKQFDFVGLDIMRPIIGEY